MSYLCIRDVVARLLSIMVGDVFLVKTKSQQRKIMKANVPMTDSFRTQTSPKNNNLNFVSTEMLPVILVLQEIKEELVRLREELRRKI